MLQTPAACFKPTKAASSSHLLKSPFFWNIWPYRITVWQDYRIEGKIALPMTSLKTSWAISLSPLFVLRKFPIKGVADGCRLRKGCGKIAKLGLRCAKLGHSWPSISTCGWLPSDLRNFLTRIDLGRMIIDPRPSFQTVWLNQKCWYLKNAQKDVECRRDAKGWLSGKVGL